MESKICTKCKQNKNFKDFYKENTKTGRSYWCKECSKEYMRNREHKKIKDIHNIIIKAIDEGVLNV